MTELPDPQLDAGTILRMAGASDPVARLTIENAQLRLVADYWKKMAHEMEKQLVAHAEDPEDD